MSIDGLVELVPLSVDIKLGQSSKAQTEAALGGVLNDPRLTAYVTKVGRRLAPFSKEPKLPYTFTVINSSAYNAFALPGGSVYITTGLLHVLRSEAQLAAVLGHEIGHAADRHGVKQIGTALGAQFLLALVGGDGETTQAARAVVQNILTSGYGRGQESDADQLGLDTAVAAGYAPTGMIDLMKVLGGETEKRPDRIASLFRTHPWTPQRLTDTKSRIQSRYPGSKGFVGEREYQMAVLGRTAAGNRAAGSPPWGVLAGIGLGGLALFALVYKLRRR